MRTGSEKFAELRTSGDAFWFQLAARLPVLTLSPRRAARRIVAAIVNREAGVVLGLPAKLLGLAHDLFPGLVVRMMGLAEGLRPRPDPRTT